MILKHLSRGFSEERNLPVCFPSLHHPSYPTTWSDLTLVPSHSLFQSYFLQEKVHMTVLQWEPEEARGRIYSEHVQRWVCNTSHSQDYLIASAQRTGKERFFLPLQMSNISLKRVSQALQVWSWCMSKHICWFKSCYDKSQLPRNYFMILIYCFESFLLPLLSSFEKSYFRMFYILQCF